MSVLCVPDFIMLTRVVAMECMCLHFVDSLGFISKVTHVSVKRVVHTVNTHNL